MCSSRSWCLKRVVCIGTIDGRVSEVRCSDV
jgi:hypothetical protein